MTFLPLWKLWESPVIIVIRYSKKQISKTSNLNIIMNSASFQSQETVFVKYMYSKMIRKDSN